MGDQMTAFQWVTIGLLVGVTIEAWSARLNARKAARAAEEAKLEIQLLRQMIDQRLMEIQAGMNYACERHGHD